MEEKENKIKKSLEKLDIQNHSYRRQSMLPESTLQEIVEKESLSRSSSQTTHKSKFRFFNSADLLSIKSSSSSKTNYFDLGGQTTNLIKLNNKLKNLKLKSLIAEDKERITTLKNFETTFPKKKEESKIDEEVFVDDDVSYNDSIISNIRKNSSKV
ncbi:hypothetical protein HDU92_000227 [Lobulomyces angularis]|nr:hypothetical protein HDU92_000227 [Lobulomyces angularis]